MLSILLFGMLVTSALTFAIYIVSRSYNVGLVGSVDAFGTYPWRLYKGMATWESRTACWVGYICHTLFVWIVIWVTRRIKPEYRSQMRWWNWLLFWGNLFFSVYHIL